MNLISEVHLLKLRNQELIILIVTVVIFAGFSIFLDKITDLDPNSFISKNQVKVHQLFFCTVMKDDVELKREGKVHILM